MSLRLPWLSADRDAPFPPVDTALRDPDGLLAAGGDLSPARLLNAYRHGIFPWYSDDQPILWWSPDPRTIFRTDGVHLSRRFRRQLRSSQWIARSDTRFAEVLDACADVPRPGQRGTWIIDEMRDAYRTLHQLGHAHSVEVFDDNDRLVGGIYGVAIGGMFFGESMVSLVSGGSKAALAALAYRLSDWGWPLIDAQVENSHLMRSGAETWPRERFLREVAARVVETGLTGSWTSAFGTLVLRDLACG
jgi:leucyl/phenylalanyl-tRNA---protein transferase